MVDEQHEYDDSYLPSVAWPYFDACTISFWECSTYCNVARLHLAGRHHFVRLVV